MVEGFGDASCNTVHVIPKDAAVDAVGEVFQACRFVAKSEKGEHTPKHTKTQK